MLDYCLLSFIDFLYLMLNMVFFVYFDFLLEIVGPMLVLGLIS